MTCPVADWCEVPAVNVADSTMVGSSSREWASQQTGEALDAGNAVATTSQLLEPHKVGAVLPPVTPVLQYKGCGRTVAARLPCMHLW